MQKQQDNAEDNFLKYFLKAILNLYPRLSVKICVQMNSALIFYPQQSKAVRRHGLSGFLAVA